MERQVKLPDVLEVGDGESASEILAQITGQIANQEIAIADALLAPLLLLDDAPANLPILSNMGLSQRIPDETTLQQEIHANVSARNLSATPVTWRFTTQKARRKLAQLYPSVST
jgi:hypothetical protein